MRSSGSSRDASRAAAITSRITRPAPPAERITMKTSKAPDPQYPWPELIAVSRRGIKGFAARSKLIRARLARLEAEAKTLRAELRENERLSRGLGGAEKFAQRRLARQAKAEAAARALAKRVR